MRQCEIPMRMIAQAAKCHAHTAIALKGVMSRFPRRVESNNMRRSRVYGLRHFWCKMRRSAARVQAAAEGKRRCGAVKVQQAGGGGQRAQERW